jgi:hypothetical protein
MGPSPGDMEIFERVDEMYFATESDPHGRKLAILRLLAEKGPLNKYNIIKHLPAKFGSRPIILEEVESLEKRHLIQVHHVNSHARGTEGVSKYYDLTLTGLVWVIGGLAGRRDRRQLDRFAEKYRDLKEEDARLTILDLWPNIKAAGIADEVARAVASDCALHPSLPAAIRRISDRALLLPIFKLDGAPNELFEPRKETAAYLAAAGQDTALRATLVQGIRFGSVLLQQLADTTIERKAELDRIAAMIEKIPYVRK